MADTQIQKTVSTTWKHPSSGGLSDQLGHGIPKDSNPDTEKHGQSQHSKPPSSLRSWWKEMLALLGSAVAISALGVFLHYAGSGEASVDLPTTGTPADNLPDQAKHLTVNTILELFKMAISFTVAIPLVECLGQLTWIWFSQKERQLSDYLLFEAAGKQNNLKSRVKMLLFAKSRPLGLLVACVVLAMLCEMLLGFFTQELVTFDILNRQDPSYGDANNYQAGEAAQLDQYIQNYSSSDGLFDPPNKLQIARLAVATSYDTGNSPYGSIDDSMKSGIWSALFATDPDANWAKPQWYCASGNCTWNDYASLGICSRCANITSTLAKNCTQNSGSSQEDNSTEVCNFLLPNGLGIGGSKVMALSTGNQPLVFGNYSNPLVVVQAIAAYSSDYGVYRQDISLNTLVNASECVLFPCGIHFQQANSQTENIDAKLGYNEGEFYEIADWASDNYTFAAGGGPLIHVPENHANEPNIPNTFNISKTAYNGLQSYLAPLLNGFVSTLPNRTLYVTTNATGGVMRDTIDSLQSFYTPWDVTCCDTYNNNFSSWAACSVIDIATGMTVAMRSSSFDEWNLSSSLALGQTLVPTAIVVVAWLWLVPIVAVWVLATILLVLTMYQSQRADLDSTHNFNSLALLFIEKEDPGMDNQEGLDISEQQAGWGDRSYQLKVDHEHLRFVKPAGDSGLRQ